MALLLSPTANTVTTVIQTPGEPSKVPLGMSMTASAIKIDVVTFYFSAFSQTPSPQPLVQDPHSTTPLGLASIRSATGDKHSGLPDGNIC